MANRDARYALGIAFIMEGVTEKVFYKTYARHAAKKLNLTCDELIVRDTPALSIRGPQKAALLLFNNVGSIDQIPNACNWFASVCANGWPTIPWHALLCYDTDNYNADVTKFHKGDWLKLRKAIGSEVTSISDLAAEADIEDLMLCDYEGVLAFLGLPADTPIPTGKKGKRKLAKLYRLVAPNVAYHSGDRARPLIEALDMERITQHAPSGVDLVVIDKLLATVSDQTSIPY